MNKTYEIRILENNLLLKNSKGEEKILNINKNLCFLINEHHFNLQKIKPTNPNQETQIEINDFFNYIKETLLFISNNQNYMNKEIKNMLQNFEDRNFEAFVTNLRNATENIIDIIIIGIPSSKNLISFSDKIEFLNLKKIPNYIISHFKIIEILSSNSIENIGRLLFSFISILNWFNLRAPEKETKYLYFFCWRVGNTTQRRLLNKNKKYIIGRGHTSDINISDDYPDVSRIHVSIEIIEDKIIIVDLNSLKGTLVNYQRIKTIYIPIKEDIDIMLGENCRCLLKFCPSIPHISELDNELKDIFLGIKSKTKINSVTKKIKKSYL